MSVIFLANQYAETPISAEYIEELYRLAVSRGYMSPNCLVQKPNELFLLAGLKVRYTDRHEKPSRRCADGEIEILCYKNPGNGYTHFVAGNGLGQVAYDPMGQSATVRDGYLESKRIFRLM